VYRRSCEIMARHLEEAVRSGASALGIIEIFVTRTLDTAEPELAALSEIGLLNQAERETVLGIYEAVVARLASVLESGAKARHLRVCDYPVVARSIISIVHSIPLHATLARTLKLDRDAIISTFTELLAIGWASDRNAVVDPPAIDLLPLLTRAGDVFDRGAVVEAKRERILASASLLFNRRGVDTTSLEDIANAIGATKRTLYRYVGDKSTILAACHARTQTIYSFIREQARAQRGCAIDTLIATMRTTLVAQQRDDIEPLRVSTKYEALSPEERQICMKRARELVEVYRALCSNTQREGSMRALNYDYLLIPLRGAGLWLAKGLVGGDEQRRAQIAAEITDLLRLGLKPI
jgi:AcrR family transcriptional regulator